MRTLTLETTLGADEVTVEFYIEPTDRSVGIMHAYAVVESVIRDGIDITQTLSEDQLEDLETSCIGYAEDYDDYDDLDFAKEG